MLSESLARPRETPIVDMERDSVHSDYGSEMADDEGEKNGSTYILNGSGAVGPYATSYMEVSSDTLTETHRLIDLAKKELMKEINLLQNQILTQKNTIEAQSLRIHELSERLEEVALQRGEVNYSEKGNAGSNQRYIYLD